MKRSWIAILIGLFLYDGRLTAQEQVTLEQVIALALQENYDIRLAQNVSLTARVNDKYSVAALFPQVTATGSKTWSHTRQTIRFDDETRNNKGINQSDNIQGAVQLVWTLFDGTKMFATRERLAEISNQGELIVKNQMVTSISEIINNYYGIVRQKQQLSAIQDQISVNEERVKLAERKLEVGIGAKPELLQAKVDLNAQRTLSLQQETLIVQLKDQLNGLVGLKLPAPYDVSDSILINLGIKQEEIFESFEERNYGLQSAKLNLSIARLALRESRADRLPVINFNALYNYTQTDNTKQINEFSTIYNESFGFNNYGFSVTLPLFNGLNTHRNVQQAKITLNRQELLYDQQKQQIDVGIKNAFVSYDNAKKILLIEEENILLAKENVFIALESFKRGVATFIELRTAQQSLAEAYNRLIAARYNAKVAETELLRLNGSLLR
jgi:outer membrane protein TolC